MSWFKNLDWYRRLMALFLLGATAALAILLGLYGHEFFLSDWFFDLLLAPSFVGGLVSSAGYLGRSIDAIVPENPNKAKHATGTLEKIGTVAGLLLGLTVGIALTVLGEAVPFLGAASTFAKVLFCFGTMGTLSSLGNRLGNWGDNNHTRPLGEKRAIGAAAIFGAIFAAAVLALKITAVVSVVGVTSFLSGGAALPLWLGGAIFVLGSSSTFASSVDYVAKGVNYVRADLKGKSELDKVVTSRKHEYRGGLMGASTGLIVAAVVIGAILVSQPYLLAGAFAVFAAIAITMSCISVLGGLFSRCGRLYDSYVNAKQAAIEKAALIRATPKLAPLAIPTAPMDIPAHNVSISPVNRNSPSRESRRSSSPSPRSASPDLADIESDLQVGNPAAHDRDGLSAALLPRMHFLSSSTDSRCHAEANDALLFPRPQSVGCVA